MKVDLEEVCREIREIGETYGARFERARILYVLETTLARNGDVVEALRLVLAEGDEPMWPIGSTTGEPER